ncbi:RGS-domain-containing protein [Plenodomus tracheiphilus IPT5]|uniref:RGS-domain-containing protein n=1 Tax=Plenodomus tracheiphilus IPT5 TaxID=1408161 RepID=A0A6A7B0A7_9PLEO|nr:RGS-domain-containing protein [Plenodomus tracheiphilus IPT5]
MSLETHAPFIPLTVSAPSDASSLHLFGDDDDAADEPLPSAEHAHHDQRYQRPARTPCADPHALSLTPSTGKSTSSAPSSRSTTSGRRYTLARFPLLRKGSRELTRWPSTNTKGNSPVESPFLATGAPRPSISTPRGRDTSPARRSIAEPREPDVINEEAEPTEHLGRKQLDKMHQTSSRLLRMTDDERPYTRVSLHLLLHSIPMTSFSGGDFKDLFSTLMVSLPLTPHRVRFRMIDYTFTSDEAITNLGSLKFSQSNRMPDPKDASRVVTTTTTTTFSMAKEMARSVCQKFLEAKFIESVEGKTDFTNKSSVWQLTPKGIHILERFCTRNGIQSAHVKAVIDSQRNPHQLVILERNLENDKLHHDEQTVEILFRRFVGTTANEAASDADSIHEFSKCDIGVKLVKHRPTTSRQFEYTFHGRNAAQWLMDCTTMVDPRESVEIGSLFLQLKLIAPVDPRNSEHTFQPVKQVHYFITPHGERVAGWTLEDIPSGNDVVTKSRDGVTRDSNSNRTNVIIRNPSWRLLYREFLKETMCEENLSFYLEVQEFNRQYRQAINDKGENKVETIRETLAAAYGLYNAFLAPGSPNELNIDHGLRTQLATRMTRAVGDDAAMLQSLNEVASLFEKAQNSIFKLMSSDSVPKFIKHPKYAPQLRGLDAAAAQAYVAASPAPSRPSQVA